MTSPAPPLAGYVPIGEIERELTRQLKQVHDESKAPVQQARMSNLVIYCNSADGARVGAEIPAIARLHPARVVLVRAEPDATQSDISAGACVEVRNLASEDRVFWEQITLSARGAACEWVPFRIRSMLIGDLPTNLWWAAPEPPPFAGAFLFDLCEHVQQVIYDSQGWTEPARGIAAAAAWLGKFERRPSDGPFRIASDLTWRRLKYWRRILAQALDPATARGALQSISELYVEHGPHAVTQAWQLVSWLASRLGWQVRAGKVDPGTEITWQAASPGGMLRVRIRRLPEGPAEISRLRLACRVNDKPAAFQIRVQDGRRLAVEPQEGDCCVRTITFQPLPVAEMLGRQLSDREPDPVFRESMAVAQIFAQSLLV
jgi:glucose-6-phosphate dehydrogenase assembly protein OpcA